MYILRVVLTVATYNVDAFNHEHTGYSCKEIASYMRNLQADILCFQEFGINDEFGIDSIYAALSNWPYHYIPSSPEEESVATGCFQPLSYQGGASYHLS